METIYPLDHFERNLLGSGVATPVKSSAILTQLSDGVAWTAADGGYGIESRGFTAPSQPAAPLREVVYVVRAVGTVSEVLCVVLAFKSSNATVAVKLQRSTFKRLSRYATMAGVTVSTVALVPAVHDLTPVIGDAASYPKLALKFTSAMSSVTESAIAPGIPRIVAGPTGDVLRYTTAPAKIFGVTVTPVGVAAPPSLVQASAPANTTAPCGSPFVPFGILSEAACDEASIPAGTQCAVRCYNGSDAVSSPRAACQSGKVSYTAGHCAPGSVQATISVAGLTETALNGTYVHDAAQSILTWKSTTNQQARIVVSQRERHRLELRKGDVVEFTLDVLDEEPAPLLHVYTPQRVRVSASTAVFGAAQTARAGSSCERPYLPFALLGACKGASVASGATCVVGCYEGFASDGATVAACTDGTFAYKTGRCLPTERLRTIVLSGLGGVKSDGTRFPSSHVELNGVYEHEATSLTWRNKSTTARIVASESEVDVLLLYTGETAAPVYAIVVSNVAVIGPKLAVYDRAAPQAKVYGAAATLGLAHEQRSILVAGLRDQALNGIYEAADPPTTPLEWRLVPASANQARIYVVSPLAMVLEFTKDDGTKSRNIAFKVTDGAPATLEVSNRSTIDPGGEPLATATFGKSACEGYWTKEWPSCTGSGDAACDTIAACATAGTGASTSTLLYSGTSIALAPLKGAAGALYGTTSDYVIYVVKPGPGSAASAASAASTAKVIRKGSGQAELLDASLVDKEWVVDAKVDASVVLGPYATAVPVVPVAPAECADLRSCLKRTPLDLSKCGVQAAACKAQPKVASGAKLEHGDKKVDLLTLGLADERALFGSDDRGVFVVSVSKDDANKGKRLYVATDGKASVVDVEYEEAKTTWREVNGMSWVLIGCAIGGGVLALILLAVVVYYVASSGGSQQTVVSYAPPFPPVSPFPPM